MGRKTFTKEFKLGAARMVVDEQRKPAEVARNLGVSAPSIGKWVVNYKKSGNGAFPGKGFLTPDEDRIRKLEKENRRLTMERDLLKKTIVLFAELDKKNITL